MDDHEYWERFRLATLWDEFRRHKFPDIDLNIDILGSRAERKREMRWMDRKYKRCSQFNWVELFYTRDNVHLYASWSLEDGPRSHYIDELRLSTWSLKRQAQEIRNTDIRDYCEHLIFVAEETLRVLDSMRG